LGAVLNALPLPNVSAASLSRQESRPTHHAHYKQRCHEDDQRPLRDTEPSDGPALSHALNYK